MRRRSFRKPAITLSLFPFLAVLVCTMGALIVLLVTVVQQARIDADDQLASEIAKAEAQDAQLEELRLAKEDHEWRRSELERQRSELQKKAAEQRLALSHYEDHIRRLQAQWQQLQDQAEELKRLKSQQTFADEDTQQRLADLKKELHAKSEQLSRAQQKSAGKEKSFAIIPYHGPNGTKRRPIYIECTDQGIVLQPEGIVLAPQDFEGSLGPGNPLDASLRTTREYLARYARETGEEPYPLLVVRPSGTVAYAVARAALKSWDDEFGYELVDADMKLAYPKPDPALKSELERTITDARQRQVVLASMMPGRFKGSGGGALVASPNGGFQPVNVSPGLSGPSRPAGGSGIPAQSASFSSSFHREIGVEADSGLTMQSAQRSLAKNKTSTSNGTSTTGTGTRTGTGTGTGTGANQESAAATSGTQGPGTGTPGTRTPSSEKSATGQSTAEFKPGLPKGGSQGDSKYGGKLGSSSGSAATAARYRGPEWGLPNRGPNETGIQRSIQVECLVDRLILVPEAGDQLPPTVIPVAYDMGDSIDPLVTAVWKRMDLWGIAGERCYWKPVLKVRVGPEAEGRFAELVQLLQNSGFTVERR